MTFDDITAESLRRIGGSKWTTFGPKTLGGFVAEMDFGAAPPITDALHAMVDDGLFGYTPPRLNQQLTVSTAGWYNRTYGWDIKPEQIRPAPDVIKVLEVAIAHFSTPGSPVVLPTPAYMPFLSVPGLWGREIIQVPMIDDEGYYRFDLDGLAAAFAQGGNLMVLVNPYNPLGRVFSREDLVAVSEVVDAAGGRVFSDEIHAPLVYPGGTHIPYASVSAAAASHTITGTSASKAWNLPGVKCAQIILSNDNDIDRWTDVGFAAHGAAMPGVIANIAAYESGRPWLDEVITYLDGNRKFLAELLAEHLPKVRYLPPEGTYLSWLDFRAYGIGDDVAGFFLENADVALTNGAAFGEAGKGFARLNFGTSRQVIEQMVTAMGAALNS